MKTRNSVASRLARLAKQKADRFDPARFCYIAALVRRSASQSATIRQRLEEKASEALDRYQQRYEKARKSAADRAVHLAGTHPDQAEHLAQRLDQCDFAGLRRQAKRIESVPRERMLAELNDQLSMAGRLANQNAAQMSFDEQLQQQEDALLTAIDNSSDRQGASTAMFNTRLRAFHFFEEHWARRHADTVAAHAVNHLPENPGHLNSQMLVTRCLAVMRRLAPDYLRRWVSLMETLLWLEEAGSQDPSRPARTRQKAQ